MRVSWVKLENDKKSFRLPENLGFDVFCVNGSDNVDDKIDELITKDYSTIVVTNDVAGFSQKINQEYLKNKKVNIVISKDNDVQL